MRKENYPSQITGLPDSTLLQLIAQVRTDMNKWIMVFNSMNKKSKNNVLNLYNVKPAPQSLRGGFILSPQIE